MLRPTGPGRQSNPRRSEFEAALRKKETVRSATNVAIRTAGQAASITGTPEVPAADPDREVIWTVDGSAMRFNLAALLAKPEVALNAALNESNAIVRSVGGKLCMLARSTDSPSQFLFSAAAVDTYSVEIAVSSIDLEPWARRSNAEWIPAEKLPSPGLTQAQVDARIKALDPSAADKFAQAALDQTHEWNLEVIQKTDPHVVRLDYDAEAKAYRGTFPISADGRVTARLDYLRWNTRNDAGNRAENAGKFLVYTYPADRSRTLANMFDNGTVDKLIVQVGSSEEEAVTERKLTLKVIEYDRIVNDLALVTEVARTSDPDPLKTADTAYVRINFELIANVVTGWARKSSKDVDRTKLHAASTRIVPDGLAVVQHNVILVGDSASGTIYAFASNGDRSSDKDVTGLGLSHVTGMSGNRAGTKLAITRGGYREPIKVFTLPQTAGQRATETGDSIAGSKLATGGSLSVWCVAWHGNDLWVIDRGRFARKFSGGSQRGQGVKLPGTEDVHSATFVGDVLLYGAHNATVYAYNVVTGQEVPGLALTRSQVTAGLSGFGKLGCMAYDPDAEILYLGGTDAYLAAFAASKVTTAFPEELYDHRTMSKARLQEEMLDAPAGDEERSFKVMVSEQQPGGASVPRTLTGTQLKYHVGVLIATLSPAAGSYSASTLPQVYWDIEAKLPDGFGQVSPNRLHSKMTVPRQLPSTWLGLLVRVKIGGTVVSEVVLPWTAYAAPVAWNQRATGSGVNVYRVAATNDSTVRTVKIVLEREWTGDTDTIYLVGNGETLLANTVFELLAWV